MSATSAIHMFHMEWHSYVAVYNTMDFQVLRFSRTICSFFVTGTLSCSNLPGLIASSSSSVGAYRDGLERSSSSERECVDSPKLRWPDRYWASCREGDSSSQQLSSSKKMSNYYQPTAPTSKAAFGLQCFWHSEAHLGSAPGVLRTRVGYASGALANPTYRNIGDHIETIEVDYDPSAIKYEDLVTRFWNAHDPTIKHKRQYISAIFYYGDSQKKVAEHSLENDQKRRKDKIVTQILPIGQFYNAEDYHQKYILRSEKPLFNSLHLSDADVITSHVAAKLNGYAAGYGTVEQFDAESKKWGLSEHQIELAREVIKKKGGKPQGCGV